jgi:lipopolysaccharide/colanic/teichoic acid biosynthesis glycosyltransferase
VLHGRWIYAFFKRAFDIVVALVALLLLMPFLPFIALAIKRNSPGPVFYIDPRQTRDGREFGCVKFRTMAADADQHEDEIRKQNEIDGLHIAMFDDPRITKVGRFLRRTNLDEAPQFLNVLLGDMSIVGPRPSPDEENRLCPGWREARLSCRAGITGLWQVCRSRNRGGDDFQEWVYYDIEYVRYQSMWLDIRIMLRTAAIVARGFLKFPRWLGSRRQQSSEPWWRPRRARKVMQPAGSNWTLRDWQEAARRHAFADA